MTDETTLTQQPNRTTPGWLTALVVLLGLATGIIFMMISMHAGFGVLGTATRGILLPLTVAGIFGIFWSIRNWRHATDQPAPPTEPYLAAAGRIGTQISATIFLAFVALFVVLLIITINTSNNNPAAGWAGLALILIAYAANLIIGVPLVLFQILWAWRPAVARWEHANLGRLRYTRIVATIAWILVSITLGLPILGGLLGYI